MKKKVFALLMLLAVLFVSCRMPDNNPPYANDTNSGNALVSSSQQDTPSVGGNTTCIHSILSPQGDEIDCSFHTIPGELIGYVGKKNFTMWLTKCNSNKEENLDTDCTSRHLTIADFIDHFDIPRDIFEAINDNYLFSKNDYNLDVLYSGDTAIIESYYTSDRTAIFMEKQFILLVKARLNQDITQEERQAWIKTKSGTEWGFSNATTNHTVIRGIGYSDTFSAQPDQYSLPEIISHFQISQSELMTAIEWAHYALGWYDYTLNTAALFPASPPISSSKVTISTSERPYSIDSSYLIPMNSAAQ